MIVEYRPSVEGLKNIYSKLLTLGGTIDIPEVGIMTIEYDNSVRDKVIDSYMEDGETKGWVMKEEFWIGLIIGGGIVHAIYQVILNFKKYANKRK